MSAVNAAADGEFIHGWLHAIVLNTCKAIACETKIVLEYDKNLIQSVSFYDAFVTEKPILRSLIYRKLFV